ncbi:Aspartate aminotransferase (AspB-4) [Carbonactinospora thermoautotrophica]|uniref:Aspartate aminotransferase (AspB-4) n=1 Tax=Carbonactinospora thermoautotrophica TaxID=1469144 RepID=A0A132MKJ3_9ACTN|nr:Aspartate aminotransferase (AspB-4) [Carbonactinospora thermoautotrophica]
MRIEPRSDVHARPPLPVRARRQERRPVWGARSHNRTSPGTTMPEGVGSCPGGVPCGLGTGW